MSNSQNPPNKLLGSKSPYLLQHAYNPVAWNPWSSDIWKEAQDKNKLVLVSIGYATCHWCHVMERESFEDHETAEIMNLTMINMKVDREERPDIDMIYMDACQLMTGKGGWPLNVICLPDGRPIYAGTYFTKPQWQQLILQLSTQYKSNPETFIEYAEKFMSELQKMNTKAEIGDLELTRKTVSEIFATYSKDIDWNEGAKNRAPKFMVPIQFEYSLDYHLSTGDPLAKDYLQLSLLKMANGGIFDSVRGGFFRYSTDSKWFAPHFEKMLYDNAQLLSLYSRAAGWLDADIFRETADKIWEFCNRELRNEPGGFYSGLDADSDGIEGRFYTFTQKELRSILNDEEFRWLSCYSHIQELGNWEHDLNIIYCDKAPLEVLKELQIDANQFHQLKTAVFKKLFISQEKRNRPSLDYKIIASWNGLMLSGLSNYYGYTFTDDARSDSILQEARHLGNWIKDTLWIHNKLYRIHAQGSTYNEGYLEDYAACCLGYLDLYKVSEDLEYLEFAKVLCDRAIELFYDEDAQLFHFTAKDSETLIIQKSDDTDDVIPSSNSMMARCLESMFTFYGALNYREIYLKMLAKSSAYFTKFPGWYAGWAQLHVLESIGNAHVAVKGNVKKPGAQERAQWPSWLFVGAMTPKHPSNWLKYNANIPDGYYLCSGSQCYEPLNSWQQVIEILDDLYSGFETP